MDEIRPYLAGTGGGELELEAIEEPIVKIRLRGPGGERDDGARRGDAEAPGEDAERSRRCSCCDGEGGIAGWGCTVVGIRARY